MTGPADGPSLAEKAGLTSGADAWHTRAVPGVARSFLLSDGPHGVRHTPPGGDDFDLAGARPATCFPPAAGLASSWDPELIGRVGAALGREARAMGVDVVLGPGMNIKRSPLGGRNFEYLSEDPHLTGRLAAAYVTGLQSAGVGACLKHYAVNNQETDRMRVSAVVDERALREIYLRAFEHVVTTADPATVMAAYNRVNGVPATEHHELLTAILRGEWGFDGVVMSDWGAVDDRVAALAAGCDLEMPPSRTDDLVAEAVASGALAESVLDDVVDRFRRLEARLPVSGYDPDRLAAVQDENLAVALEAALQSAVLLANDGVLPLDPDRSVAVIGELARTPRYQGGGSSHVVPTALESPLEALTGRLGAALTGFAPGYRLDGEAEPGLVAEAVALAGPADVTVLFLGLPSQHESEGFDRTDLDLPADQRALLDAVADVVGRVVVVLANGGVVSVADWRHRANAVLEGWLLGQAGGPALAALLTGDVSPSGRLAETVPVRLEDHPSYLTFPGADGVSLYGEGVFVGYRGLDRADAPVAFPFGHGLTYGTVEYGDLRVERGEHGIEVGFRLTNTSPRTVAEVAQVYVGPGADVPGPARAPRELRGFVRAELRAGESRQVRVDVAEDDLAVWDARLHRWRVDPGTYHVQVGASSRDLRLTGPVTVAGNVGVPVLTAGSTIAEWAEHPTGGPVLLGLLESTGLAGRSAAVDPELLAIFQAMPLDKLRSFGLGLDHAAIAALVAAAAEPAAATGAGA